MTRREFARTVCLTGSAVSLLGCGAEDEAKPVAPPNIVFIMADDLGYRHLGCYGQDKIRTPNIDRLASQGVKFSDAYAGCTVCAPSRSVLMTGLHTGHTPVRGNSGGLPLPAESTTVAEILKQAGYVTGCYGKWGLGERGTEGVPTRQGFDEYLGPLHQIHAQYYYPEFLVRNEDVLPLPGNRGGAKGQYAPDVIRDGAIEFIRANRERPFFLYFPSIVPHHEYQVPEENLAEYDGKFPEPAPFIRDDRGFEVQHKPVATLAGMITRLDADVGQLLAALDEAGVADNTIVFFTSDNGAAGSFRPLVDPLNPSGPLRGFKTDLYEGGIRVPMIVRWPGVVDPGSESDYPWGFWDFLPTAAELAGAQAPGGLDGISVVPALKGEQQAQQEFLYWETGSGDQLAQAVRMGDWKAVRLAPGAPLELYDLAADLGESNDVAGDHPDVVERIERYLAGCRHDPPEAAEPGWLQPEAD